MEVMYLILFTVCNKMYIGTYIKTHGFDAPIQIYDNTVYILFIGKYIPIFKFIFIFIPLVRVLVFNISNLSK